MKPNYDSETSRQKFDRYRTLLPSKLITIKNYNSIIKPKLPVKTVSSSTVQFLDTEDRLTKRKGNLIVAKNKFPASSLKRERKESLNLPNGRSPGENLRKKKNKLNKKKKKPEKKKKQKKQGNSTKLLLLDSM